MHTLLSHTLGALLLDIHGWIQIPLTYKGTYKHGNLGFFVNEVQNRMVTNGPLVSKSGG